MNSSLHLTALEGFPMVEPGDDIARSIIGTCKKNGVILQDGDLLVIAQKVISKAENRYCHLNSITPSDDAIKLANEVDKDPRLVECILRESSEVLRTRPGVIIVRHKLGYVHANAGADQSNIRNDESDPRVLLLPQEPDASAARLRQAIREELSIDINIIISDSAGRPWRNGIAGFAIGTAGFVALDDRIGTPDLYGRELQVTQIAIADELAAAASVLMGQGDEGKPVILVRGANLKPSTAGSADLIRDPAMDLFK